MVEVLQHIGLVLLYVVLLLLNVCIFLGIPGGWIAFGALAALGLYRRRRPRR